MSFAVACFLPLVMLAMLLLLARIEERHLKARPARVGADAENAAIAAVPELN